MDDNTSGVDRGVLPGHLQAPLLHAGFWRRFAAYVIDMLILVPVFVVLELVWMFPLFTHAYQPSNDVFPIGRFLGYLASAIVIPWLYFAICESSKWQATVGKLALGLRVTDMQGRRIGFGCATGRYFGKVLSGVILDIGYMLAGWTERKQALHDLMANCCVVRKEGLAMFERGEPVGVPGAPSTAMPGWAIGLIVAGVFFVCVVPVLAILAAIAIPAYNNYLIRSQVSEGIALSHTARVAVTQYIASHGALPDDNANAGLAAPEQIHGKFVASVAVRQGQVVVTYGDFANPEVRGDHLVLVPQGDLADLHWQCRSPDIKVRYLPSQCRE